jgi:hypothetical protein
VKPYRHRYNVNVIKMALDLHGQAGLGCRKISRVLQIINQQAPHHTTIRQWIIRNGCYVLNSPLERGSDWVVIADLTIDIGKMKCLAIIGVRMSRLKDDLTLGHKDVEILGLHPIEKSNGIIILSALEEARKRLGEDFQALVIDQGPDIKKGAKLFSEKYPNTKILHDIPHKLAIILRKELAGDKKWTEYMKLLKQTKNRVQQTELAALLPASGRVWDRELDIGYLFEWKDRLLISKENGNLDSIKEERFLDYFGWIFDYDLSELSSMVEAAKMIKEAVRRFGLSLEVYDYLDAYFENIPIEEKRLRDFGDKALTAIWEEVEKLSDNQTLICSTEVLESIFGKYKEMNSNAQGVTGNVLSMATYVGSKENDIKQVMEGVSLKQGIKWIKEKVGHTIASFRKHFFKGSNRTKFDIQEELMLAC